MDVDETPKKGGKSEPLSLPTTTDYERFFTKNYEVRLSIKIKSKKFEFQKFQKFTDLQNFRLSVSLELRMNTANYIFLSNGKIKKRQI